MSGQDDDLYKALRAMCEGSTEAFDLIYAKFAPLVMQIAARLLADRMEAEDICHDVFLEVLRRGVSYDPSRGSMTAWIAVITRSRCLDRMRVRSRWQHTDEAEEERITSPELTEELVIHRLQQQDLHGALEALPSEQMQAIVSSYFSEHTQRQMSESWNVPLGTVKSWVRYGISNLRKQMEKRGWAREPDNGPKEVRR
ncbi:sigma-70 family RNA polymerase sigma factor [Paenibacillus sp. PR3]|uniref:Sigma-70 family RNA polymerase sigma factor n=1 Tax=Paenibacillus terricola TaxID=2763503 RepID=A0ABR8MTZ9_9BACL|nr:sigma-70 family RNA polymerase sigma factor [Paenibacillus terricola]MBD3919438.1 sigma-70 family RNA polymerase sigma factor [Paenibacillus terricola]